MQMSFLIEMNALKIKLIYNSRNAFENFKAELFSSKIENKGKIMCFYNIVCALFYCNK